MQRSPRSIASIPRSQSPVPITLTESPPLHIRKIPANSFSSPISGSPISGSLISGSLKYRSRSPPISCRPSTPKPAIRLFIPDASFQPSGCDSPLFGAYYGRDGALTSATSTASLIGNTTICPMPVSMTCVHRGPLGTPHGFFDVKKLLDSFDDPTSRWSDKHFEELSRLGEGASGTVHQVKDKRMGKFMARKTIGTLEAPMKQLVRELSIISSVEHVNIIRFHGACMSPTSSEMKIYMEFCEGGSLEAISKRIKDLPGAAVGESIAGRLAEGVLQGLAYLHSKKIVHRDIKPSNILISREGVVKLCDFGVSGELVKSSAGTPNTGTSFYMAPERICGKEYTIRSDVWSTGISLLELVQNRFPFPKDLGVIELVMYIMTPPRLEDEPGAQWSDAMKDFIKQALTVDSGARPSPEEMLTHPWVVNVMKQDVQMARWICQVWGWQKLSPKLEGRMSWVLEQSKHGIGLCARQR